LLRCMVRLKVLRAELARLAQDGRLRGGRLLARASPPLWDSPSDREGMNLGEYGRRYNARSVRAMIRGPQKRLTALPIGRCAVIFATKLTLNGGNGLAGAQMSRKTRT
jgi:hypothetical protein